jgi:predicted anti-sigma-YlaC factor YlaD
MTDHPPDEQASAEPGRKDLDCQDLVELFTDYLDGALPVDVRAQVEEHLAGCDGCQNVLAQWRTVIALAGRLDEADVDNTDEITRDRLISIMRGLRRR